MNESPSTEDYRGVLQNQTYCWSHNRYEDLNENTHTVCGECFHAFPTVEELVADFNRKVTADDQPDLTVDEVDSIFFCPHCIHDF
jgi:hypothetical protein